MSASCIWKWLTNSDFTTGGRRAITHEVLKSIPFELALGCVTTLNLVLIVFEVDAAASGHHYMWIEYMNRGFIVIYVCELLLRFFVLRLQMFRDPYTVVDALVAASDILVALASSGDVPKSSMVRMVRLAKLSRTSRLFSFVPELELMLKGLWGACMSIVWGSILCSGVLLIWSILAVEFIDPVNHRVEASGYYNDNPCPRCSRAYSTVGDSMLTILQTILFGDSWGTYAVPIIEEEPGWVVYFLLVYVTINLAVLNLILAVICDSAQQARQLSVKDEIKRKERAFLSANKRLKEICASLDPNNAGITLAQLQEGLHTNGEFSDIMKQMEIRSEDLPAVFGVMDLDGSGDVSSEEFTQELYRLQKNDTTTMLLHIKHYIAMMRKQMVEVIDGVRVVIDIHSNGSTNDATGSLILNDAKDMLVSGEQVLEDTAVVTKEHGLLVLPTLAAAGEYDKSHRPPSIEAPANGLSPFEREHLMNDSEEVDVFLPRILHRLDEISHSISNVVAEMHEIYGDISRSAGLRGPRYRRI